AIVGDFSKLFFDTSGIVVAFLGLAQSGLCCQLQLLRFRAIGGHAAFKGDLAHVGDRQDDDHGEKYQGDQKRGACLLFALEWSHGIRFLRDTVLEATWKSWPLSPASMRLVWAASAAAFQSLRASESLERSARSLASSAE